MPGNTFDIGNAINVWDRYFGKGKQERESQFRQQQAQTLSAETSAGMQKAIHDAVMNAAKTDPLILTAPYAEAVSRAHHAETAANSAQYGFGQQKITNQNFSNEFPGQTPDSQRLITQERGAQADTGQRQLELLSRQEGVDDLKKRGLPTHPTTEGIIASNEHTDQERFRNLMASETMDRQNEQFNTRQRGEAIQAGMAYPQGLSDKTMGPAFRQYFNSLGGNLPPIPVSPESEAALRQLHRQGAAGIGQPRVQPTAAPQTQVDGASGAGVGMAQLAGAPANVPMPGQQPPPVQPQPMVAQPSGGSGYSGGKVNPKEEELRLLLKSISGASPTGPIRLPSGAQTSGDYPISFWDTYGRIDPNSIGEKLKSFGPGVTNSTGKVTSELLARAQKLIAELQKQQN